MPADDRDYSPDRSPLGVAWAASCIRRWMTRTAGMCPWRQPWSSPSAPRPSGSKKGGADWQELKAALFEPLDAKARSCVHSRGKPLCFLRMPMQPIWWRRSLVCEMTAWTANGIRAIGKLAQATETETRRLAVMIWKQSRWPAV